jgi:predicted Fe-S protein YdhL (DUF1289 family)
MNKLESPCVRNCCLNKDDICTGCLRSLDEIKEWATVSEEARKEIIARVNSQKKLQK